MKKKKNKKWMRPRHRLVRNLLYGPIWLYSRLKYGARVTRFAEQGDRQYLILMNHQAAFDQFFVGMAFRGPVYYIASEDLFSKGFVSSLIRYLVAPIPIKKQTTDVHAVIQCLRLAKEGGTIAMAPEGNRTFSGKTEYMSPAVAGLARKLGLPIALFRIEGGYGAHPRWSDVVRNGSMRAYVSEVIEPEAYAELSDEALYAKICEGLYVDEGCVDQPYHHKKLAEYMERAYYVCPFCGLSTFESCGDTLTCLRCGRQVRYLPSKELEGVDVAFPFRFTTEWYAYQYDYINGFDTEAHTETPLYRETASLYEVIVYEKRLLIAEKATLSLYGNRLEVTIEGQEGLSFDFDAVTAMTVVGRNKLNIYADKKLYQIKGDVRFNALKYVQLCYRHRNISKGDINGKFLGI